MSENMNFYERVGAIQLELKAPKNLYNSFGKYKYRNAESICEAVKPLLNKYKCVLFLTDDVQLVGDRFYIKATATIRDMESDASVSVSAIARESLNKKGQDESQITGTASSYARKYALNGLFLLDDTKDADTDEYHNQTQGGEDKPKTITKEMYEELKELCGKAERDEAYIAKSMSVTKLEYLPYEKYATVKAGLQNIINKKL